ncbi:MAG: DUF4402 domain-containing protein [Bacteroidetes bacterium]|nr:DUF4402 domain-containing protein [Bacteroidota bacterium]
MKEFPACIAIFLVLSALHSTAFCQVIEVSEAKISATIVEPGSMAKTINTDFGNVAIILSAFVKMAPIGARSTKGGIILPVSSGTFTAAIYDYTGTAGLTYTVSYPTTPIIIGTGSDAMQVASFTSDPARNSGSDLIAGVFVSVTPANVTVNYN